MFEEFAGNVLIRRVERGQVQSDFEHVQAVHGHPTRTVGLFEQPAAGERRAAIENANVIETEEAAFKNVGAFRVFSIDPPGEVHEQLVEDALEKRKIPYAFDAAINLEYTQGSPSVNRRIDIAKRPFVSGNLPVGMHVPFAEK